MSSVVFSSTNDIWDFFFNILILKVKFFDYFAAFLCREKFSAALPVGRERE